MSDAAGYNHEPRLAPVPGRRGRSLEISFHSLDLKNQFPGIGRPQIAVLFEQAHGQGIQGFRHFQLPMRFPDGCRPPPHVRKQHLERVLALKGKSVVSISYMIIPSE